MDGFNGSEVCIRIFLTLLGLLTPVGFLADDRPTRELVPTDAVVWRD